VSGVRRLCLALPTDADEKPEDALSLDCVRTIGGTRRWLPPLVEDREGDCWPSFERRKKILINTPIQDSGADLVIWAVNRFMHELPCRRLVARARPRFKQVISAWLLVLV
jgi:hypothetical protein